MRKQRLFSSSSFTLHFTLASLPASIFIIALISLVCSNTAIAGHEPTIEMGISEYSKIDQDHAVPAKVGDGDNVKHGDLSSALFMPDKNVDIHMDAGGLDFSCVTCHVGEGHEWAGSRYEMTVNDKVGTIYPPPKTFCR